MKQTHDTILQRAGNAVYKRMTWENAVRAALLAGSVTTIGAAGSAFMAAPSVATAGQGLGALGMAAAEGAAIAGGTGSAPIRRGPQTEGVARRRSPGSTGSTLLQGGFQPLIPPHGHGLGR